MWQCHLTLCNQSTAVTSHSHTKLSQQKPLWGILFATNSYTVSANIYNLLCSFVSVHHTFCGVAGPVAGLPTFRTCQSCYNIVVLHTIKVFCAVTPCWLQTAVSDQSQDFSIREHWCESPELLEPGAVRVRRCESPELLEPGAVKVRSYESPERWESEAVRVRSCESPELWESGDVRVRSCESPKLWESGDVRVRRCESPEMWESEAVRVRRCESPELWESGDVRARRCDSPEQWESGSVRVRSNESPELWESRASLWYRFVIILPGGTII